MLGHDPMRSTAARLVHPNKMACMINNNVSCLCFVGHVHVIGCATLYLSNASISRFAIAQSHCQNIPKNIHTNEQVCGMQYGDRKMLKGESGLGANHISWYCI